MSKGTIDTALLYYFPGEIFVLHSEAVPVVLLFVLILFSPFLSSISSLGFLLVVGAARGANRVFPKQIERFQVEMATLPQRTLVQGPPLGMHSVGHASLRRLGRLEPLPYPVGASPFLEAL